MYGRKLISLRKGTVAWNLYSSDSVFDVYSRWFYFLSIRIHNCSTDFSGDLFTLPRMLGVAPGILGRITGRQEIYIIASVDFDVLCCKNQSNEVKIT